MDRLAVSVSEGQLHEVAAPAEFETDGPFLVEVSNRGRDAHVHLRLDDALAGVATLAETNPHVPRDETVEIVADVDAVATSVAGFLTVETGYGADGSEVAVTVHPPAVTESAGTTRASDGGAPAATAATGDADAAGEATASSPVDSERLSTDSGVDLVTVVVALLALGAVGVAAGAVALVADPIVALGAAAVVLAVVAAVLLLVR